MRCRPSWARTAILALSVTRPLAAQAFHLSASGVGAGVRLQSVIPSLSADFTGAAFGVEGRVMVGRVGVELSYLQGTLTSSTSGLPSRDLVDGKVLLNVQPADWLMVKVGPHVRSYVVGGATQRWVFWEARSRAEGGLVGAVVTGYAEFWRALSAQVNLPEAFDYAQGGEIGLRLRPSRGPLCARLAYQVDYAQLGGGAQVRTLETLVAGVGIVFP